MPIECEWARQLLVVSPDDLFKAAYCHLEFDREVVAASRVNPQFGEAEIRATGQCSAERIGGSRTSDSGDASGLESFRAVQVY
jgi:hypothetical protein